MSKARIPAREKLAAALLMCMGPDENGKLVRLISHEEAKRMTADQIISRYNFDHYPVREVDGGPAAAWNLTPRLVADHRRKTAMIDLPEIAKSKRIRRREAEHALRMAGKPLRVDVRGGMGGGEPPKKIRRKWPSRPFPKRHKQPKRGRK